MNDYALNILRAELKDQTDKLAKCRVNEGTHLSAINDANKHLNIVRRNIKTITTRIEDLENAIRAASGEPIQKGSQMLLPEIAASTIAVGTSDEAAPTPTKRGKGTTHDAMIRAVHNLGPKSVRAALDVVRKHKVGEVFTGLDLQMSVNRSHATLHSVARALIIAGAVEHLGVKDAGTTEPYKTRKFGEQRRPLLIHEYKLIDLDKIQLVEDCLPQLSLPMDTTVPPRENDVDA